MPTLLLLALWTGNTAAATHPRHGQCLFDLTIEELMEIRIGAELRLGCWTSLDNGSLEADQRGFQAESKDVGQPRAARLHISCGGHAAEANKPFVTWNQ